MATTFKGRTFDRVVHLDERSRQYPVRAVIRQAVQRRNKLWNIGDLLPIDQGSEGACVGFGLTGELLTTPVAVNLANLAITAPEDPTAFASYLYGAAKKVDEWAGEDYDGTSVLAGLKTLSGWGLVREYRWAFDINDVVDSILTKGPVIFGTNWLSGMYEAPNGILTPSGDVVGGHCYLGVGYKLYDDPAEDAILLLNSWGCTWGRKGIAEIKVSDMARLLKDSGEAAVITHRSYGTVR